MAAQSAPNARFVVRERDDQFFVRDRALGKTQWDRPWATRETARENAVYQTLVSDLPRAN